MFFLSPPPPDGLAAPDLAIWRARQEADPMTACKNKRSAVDTHWVGDVERAPPPLEVLGPARHLVLDERAEALRAPSTGPVEGSGLGQLGTIAAAR
jgi:hypothetical protein